MGSSTKPHGHGGGELHQRTRGASQPQPSNQPVNGEKGGETQSSSGHHDSGAQSPSRSTVAPASPHTSTSAQDSSSRATGGNAKAIVSPICESTTFTFANIVIHLLICVAAASRMLLQMTSIYLLKIDLTVISYCGFAFILSARLLIWVLVKPSWERLYNQKKYELAFVAGSPFLLFIFFAYFDFIRHLVRGLEWHGCLFCVYPLIFEFFYRQFGPKKEALEKIWVHAQYPHYKPKAMNSVLKHLFRETSIRIIETVWYMAILPFLLVPGDHVIINFVPSIVMVVCSIIDLVAMHCTITYRWHWLRLHICASQLGCWKPCKSTASKRYTAGTAFMRGEVVRHRKDNYRAMDIINTADPGSKMSRIFWHLFRTPADVMGNIAIVQLWALVVQFGMLCVSKSWFMVVLWGLSQCVSYLTIGHTLHLRNSMLADAIPLATDSKTGHSKHMASGTTSAGTTSSTGSGTGSGSGSGSRSKGGKSGPNKRH